MSFRHPCHLPEHRAHPPPSPPPYPRRITIHRYPNFRFETIPDGVEHENPVSADRFMEVMEGIDTVSRPLFREMMISGSLSSRSVRPVTVMILDAFFSFGLDVAIETSIPVVFFETVSPCFLWTCCLNLPTLIEAGEVPFQGVYSLNYSVAS
ncbi:unnamed protein product [Lactuca virosa]|uniref:Uncharacterized protein n=1 Tax=Lactuca virosa TaxID=75947 RepID=A0AAU9MXZ6_9ASTR|nr:unnamed protein product [Lactuca virosa]